MKTLSSGVRHYANKQEYLKKGAGTEGLNKTASAAEKAKEVPKEKVDLSDQAKTENIKEEAKETAKKATDSTGSVASAADKASTGLNVAKTLASAITPTGPTPKPPLPKVDGTIKGAQSSKLLSKNVNSPGIYFITGYELLSFTDDGLNEMAEFVPNSQKFGWDQEDEILADIKRKAKDQPVVLIGHSFGGDTAVSIANKLNSPEFGFRKVDLLTTLDSVGFDNDIIPKNVVKNLNFIGDQDLLLNDGPNVARDSSKTKVINELREENHVSMDEAEDVQFKIFEEIDSVMAKKKDTAMANVKSNMRELLLEMLAEKKS